MVGFGKNIFMKMTKDTNKENTFELLKRVPFNQVEFERNSVKLYSFKERDDFFINRGWTYEEYKGECYKKYGYK